MKKFASVLILLSLSLSLAACTKTAETKGNEVKVTEGKPEEKTENTTSDVSTVKEFKFGKVKIQALGGGACGAPSYIAFEKGFFAEEGLDVELVSGNLDELKTGLATGEFLVTNGDFQWFPSIQQGLDLRVIGGLHKGCIKLVIPPNSPIKTAADLKGKNIGVDEVGGTPMSVASVVLANAGIDPEKGVTWKQFPLDQLTQAVDNGEVDAFAAWDPFGTLAVKEHGYTILSDISTDPIFADKSCCFLYSTQKQLEKNPEKIAAIARAYQKAADWIRDNPEETAQIEIEKKYVATGDKELLTELISSYDFEYTTDAARSDVKYFAEQLSKTGFVKKDTNAEEFTAQVYYDILKK
ncbi:MAG: ABC-type nitrate/sulfonate/bicarbonate transport system, periplasmic component [Clostridia bacterium]|nr:ABC-type nitrate/sulfonate/bicarbonate transport system, periplasmic component [Clostridia bacterium]